MNTRAGDGLNIRFDHDDAVAANYATSMHVVLHADCVSQIQEQIILLKGLYRKT